MQQLSKWGVELPNDEVCDATKMLVAIQLVT